MTSLCMFAGTADRAQVHAYDLVDYSWVCSWSFNDIGINVSENHVTSVACSATNDDVAVAVTSSFKVWNLGYMHACKMVLTRFFSR